VLNSDGKYLSNAEFKELQDFIYQQSGMFFPLSRKHYIEQKIARRIQVLNYQGFREYLNVLKSSVMKAEIINLFNDITVNETFFFRDLPQLEVLEKHIFPEAAARGKTTVNILSAGCSSGEEAYTAAMILSEKFPALSYNILGVDISDVVLAKAIRAEYSPYAVRLAPKAYLNKYFSLTGSGNYKLLEHYKTNVKFLKLNLMELDAARLNISFDVILCRYVLIYFDRRSKRKVIEAFYRRSAPHGYLILGNSESLFSISDDFKMLHFPSAVIYARKEGKAATVNEG
jgi:chemotaxis protein methyltransferase CheR